ncbi:MAG: hypothetical protein RL434_2918 [Pseudomonadota bacterium]|jgi:hypothetical protein
MISIRKEGDYFKIGLNLCFAWSRFSAHWVWYDFASRTGSARGFTISRKGFRRRSETWNVIENYLSAHGMSAVLTEVLEDLKDTERWAQTRSERGVIIKPNRLDRAWPL